MKQLKFAVLLEGWNYKEQDPKKRLNQFTRAKRIAGIESDTKKKFKKSIFTKSDKMHDIRATQANRRAASSERHQGRLKFHQRRYAGRPEETDNETAIDPKGSSDKTLQIKARRAGNSEKHLKDSVHKFFKLRHFR